MVPSVLVDFDGTIAVEDTTDLLLDRFADPLWRAAEADWVAGRIGSRECLSRQIDLVRASPTELQWFADGVAVDPDFVDFVATGRALGLRMVIASDGFDFLILRVLKRIGVSLPVVSNRLLAVGEDRWRAEFPHFVGDCRSQSGNCKCALFGINPPPTVLIGDGRSDYCPAALATLVFAKKSLATHCQEDGIDHIKIDGFSDATLALRAYCLARDRVAAVQSDKSEAFHA
jgi:2-hydroxy-3-keto-5-methylthiopentenyl-1-phosphate phosphatase